MSEQDNNVNLVVCDHWKDACAPGCRHAVNHEPGQFCSEMCFQDKIPQYQYGHCVPVGVNPPYSEVDRLKKSNEELLEALREIAKGEGAFSRDPAKHLENCFLNMKDIAVKAIARVEEVAK